MKPAYVLAFLALLWPATAWAQPPFGRQLHYAGVRTIGDERAPVALDIDIGRADSDEVTWIVVDERVGQRDLGIVHVTLDRSGALGSNVAKLTVEEQTVLEMIALQFEDVDGVDPGDNWVRTADFGEGTRQTHFLVRSAADGMIRFEITRSLGGFEGALRGAMSYDAKIAAPTELELNGNVPNGFLGFSLRLSGDSFQPRTAELR